MVFSDTSKENTDKRGLIVSCGDCHNVLVSINVVTLRWARLVAGWVTVFVWVNYLGI